MERKRAVLAGSWYPGSASECIRDIQTFLEDIPGPAAGDFGCGIVPHAGWFYSGSLACRIMASLKRTGVDLVVVFGVHMHSGMPAVVLESGSWETPLGDIAVDVEVAGELCREAGCLGQSPERFPDENTIEVQLPMIRYFFPDAALVAVGVPPVVGVASKIGRAVVAISSRCNRSMVAIGSTDLTHYGETFGFVPAGNGKKAHDWVVNENDRNAIQAMLAMDPEAIIDEAGINRNLCCSGAAAAAAVAARAMDNTRSMKLDYATSYEKSPGNSFVGYAGILYGK